MGKKEELKRKKILDVIEDLQAAILHAGGGFMRRDTLLNQTLQETLERFLLNNIIFKITHKDAEGEKWCSDCEEVSCVCNDDL